MVTSDAAGPTTHDTVMWEVRAAPGRMPELLEWVGDLPAPPGGSADVYTAADDRVVVILRTPGSTPGRLPTPPEGLLARPAHQWPFAFQRSLGSTG
ncbi:hypothetical protein ABIA33_005166 [Streptacidiphilus sp. MAP12-16]|uniref:hypothetical protein n=1 Tax=Streptacidiphilus sp. MAP12-16 TaxID=3156300 RepID=UPI0035169995